MARRVPTWGDAVSGFARIAACLLLLVLLAPASSAEVEGWAYELSDNLMSPYCPGRALSECPSGAAEDLRRWIIAQEEAGVSRLDVEAALQARFGDTLLQAPRAEGVGLVAYVVPGVLIVLGALLVLGVLLRRSRPEAPATPRIDPALARKLDGELED